MTYKKRNSFSYYTLFFTAVLLVKSCIHLCSCTVRRDAENQFGVIVPITSPAISKNSIESEPQRNLKVYEKQVKGLSGIQKVKILEVPLEAFRLKIGLAHNRIGCTEELGSIAQRYGAIAAINGCFFDAYSNLKVRNPYGTLIIERHLLHLSDHPTLLGWWPDGRVTIGQVKFRIVGALDNSDVYPNNWYAYGINDYPEGSNWAEIYTSQWALNCTPKDGLQIVVRKGRVVQKGLGSHMIPEDGFVLYLRGHEKYLEERFAIGRLCNYRIEQRWVLDNLNWLEVEEALGCGPLLVYEGQIIADPSKEGFKDPKILQHTCRRSAVGLTNDRRLLLVIGDSLTIRNLAFIMQQLGSQKAMNLDGGASSGLWFQGSYIVKPGRPISNALLILPSA